MSRTFSGLLVSLVLGAVSLGGCINPTVEPGSAGRGSQSSGAPVQHGSDRLRTVFWPCYELHSERTWQLNLPHGERFDASGLVFTPQGDLLTVSDQGASVYRIEFLSGTNAANLVQLPDCFTAAQLAPFAKLKFGHYDCEGLTLDSRGRIYLCEEANRWVLRWDPETHRVERLEIDWSSVQKYFDPIDRNASFEGITIGNGKLYVANERQIGRIIVVDLMTLKVLDDYAVQPSTSIARDVHYSDLCWFDQALFVLLRESRCILKVDPSSKKVIAEYRFGDMEQDPEVNYLNRYPTGTMEGLAVQHDSFWLVTDNNGRGRVRYPADRRPTLFKCPRPDAS